MKRTILGAVFVLLILGPVLGNELEIDFDNPSNFTYDNTIVEFSSGTPDIAALKLVGGTGQTFEQDFASSTGFTWNASFSEFVGGQVEQVSQIPASATFGATYNSTINGSWGDGVLTGTPTGGAAVSGGKLDLAHSDVRYVDYDADLNADHQQTGCIRFKVTPNYTGNPGSAQTFLLISKAHGDADNAIKIYQSSTLIFTVINNSAGGSILSNAEVWSPTSGVEYEIEFNWDITAGAIRLFVDGNQLGPTHASTGTRDSSIALLRTGADTGGSNSSNFKIDDLEIFSEPQHVTNYTPGYTLPETAYATSTVELPAFSNPFINAIDSYDAFNASETNNPRYTVNGQYWTGAAWAATSDTWATANASATISSNISTLTATDTVQIDIFFASGSAQMAVDNLVLEYTVLGYSTTDPIIQSNSGTYADALTGYSANTTEVGSDAVGHQLKVDGQAKWWNGAAWSNSDGSYAQSNTPTEIDTNAAALSISGGVLLVPQVVMHSDDGGTTPSISSLTIGFDFFVPQPTEPARCTVYGFAQDIIGVIPSSGSLIVRNHSSFFNNGHTIFPNVQETAVASSNGYFEISLVETETATHTYSFILEYTDHNSVSRRSIMGEAEVPNSTSVNITTLTFE